MDSALLIYSFPPTNLLDNVASRGRFLKSQPDQLLRPKVPAQRSLQTGLRAVLPPLLSPLSPTIHLYLALFNVHPKTLLAHVPFPGEHPWARPAFLFHHLKV